MTMLVGMLYSGADLCNACFGSKKEGPFFVKEHPTKTKFYFKEKSFDGPFFIKKFCTYKINVKHSTDRDWVSSAQIATIERDLQLKKKMHSQKALQKRPNWKFTLLAQDLLKIISPFDQNKDFLQRFLDVFWEEINKKITNKTLPEPPYKSDEMIAKREKFFIQLFEEILEVMVKRYDYTKILGKNPNEKLKKGLYDLFYDLISSGLLLIMDQERTHYLYSMPRQLYNIRYESYKKYVFGEPGLWLDCPFISQMNACLGAMLGYAVIRPVIENVLFVHKTELALWKEGFFRFITLPGNSHEKWDLDKEEFSKITKKLESELLKLDEIRLGKGLFEDVFNGFYAYETPFPSLKVRKENNVENKNQDDEETKEEEKEEEEEIEKKFSSERVQFSTKKETDEFGNKHTNEIVESNTDQPLNLNRGIGN